MCTDVIVGVADIKAIMWNIREYYLQELSELINLDKSWN